MKLTGPLGDPPPEISSELARIRLRFAPEPDPPLKIFPSSTYQLRMLSIVSSTESMKQALLCCGISGTPILNQTGELNDAFWSSNSDISSSAKTPFSSLLAKYPPSSPQLTIWFTTRFKRSFSDFSLCSVSNAPQKYF